ncbi:uncharacterized protein BKA78DRAFT_305382 [Phyllosticta capitalensis]|uniref:uncharacterized protein n=1 Tax=Phyllosticta capitalensis TaxID=121624 RepID=UPI00312CFAA3
MVALPLCSPCRLVLNPDPAPFHVARGGSAVPYPASPDSETWPRRNISDLVSAPMTLVGTTAHW